MLATVDGESLLTISSSVNIVKPTEPFISWVLAVGGVGETAALTARKYLNDNCEYYRCDKSQAYPGRSSWSEC